MKIAFLYNHDQIHQIAHSVPIAAALARLAPDVAVVLAVSNEAIAAEVARLWQRLAPGMPAPITRLHLHSRTSRLTAALLGKLVPANKLLLYRDNLDFFRSLDALVVTERTSLVLKTTYGLDTLPIFLADHGAGDRAIGFGQSTALFDHILAAGPKICDRLVADAGVAGDRISITGYPKFDFAAAATDTPAPAAPILPMLANGRPTVLYNPHPSPHLSSWYRQGEAILEWFYRSSDYNLIFAPHIMLFHRRIAVTIDKLRVARVGRVQERYRNAPNIHVDLGSVRSTDMTYTNAADIYLGDASSQIYEFLLRPRPCVFVNAHGPYDPADPNFAHWQAGPVITAAGDLGDALAASRRDHELRYKPVQQMLFAKTFDGTFDGTGTPSGERAARRMLELLGKDAA
jgi:hypothetical protein